jgi:hypothetical protein
MLFEAIGVGLIALAGYLVLGRKKTGEPKPHPDDIIYAQIFNNDSDDDFFAGIAFELGQGEFAPDCEIDDFVENVTFTHEAKPKRKNTPDSVRFVFHFKDGVVIPYDVSSLVLRDSPNDVSMRYVIASVVYKLWASNDSPYRLYLADENLIVEMAFVDPKVGVNESTWGIAWAIADEIEKIHKLKYQRDWWNKQKLEGDSNE